MNRLASILSSAQVLAKVDVTSKKRAFEEAGLLFENLHGLSRALVTDSLFSRERLGSTGLGHGVAIPHGRIKGLRAPMAAVFQLAQSIGFDAPDDKAVNLLIFLLVPEAATQKHLEILSEIAELLSDASLREKLAAAPDASALHDLIAGWQSAVPGCLSRRFPREQAVKPTVVSADVLFEEFRSRLHWEWVAGLGASERRFDEVAVRAARSGADLVGYLNYIHPYRAQILGEREMAYLTNATPEDCAGVLRALSPWSHRFWCWQMAKWHRQPCWPCASAHRFPCSRPRSRQRLSLMCCGPICPSILPTARPCTACSWTFWAWAC
jgi:PTS system nitrogen regulatory IIA component